MTKTKSIKIFRHPKMGVSVSLEIDNNVHKALYSVTLDELMEIVSEFFDE